MLRLQVPGGWLYVTAVGLQHYAAYSAPCFVRDPRLAVTLEPQEYYIPHSTGSKGPIPVKRAMPSEA